MSHIRRNTNKGRGHLRKRCPACGKLGLGPMKIRNVLHGEKIVARSCRYCDNLVEVENTKRRTITILQLEVLSACGGQIQNFKSAFGDSVEITEAKCLKYASVFDWGWAARHLLSPLAQAKYKRVTAAARAERERVTASARAKRERVTAPAQAEYERVTAPALAEYDRVTAPAWAEYERVTAAAWAEYYRVRAATFGRLYAGGA